MQQVLFLISLETQNLDYPSVSLIFSSMDGLLQVHLSVTAALKGSYCIWTYI